VLKLQVSPAWFVTGVPAGSKCCAAARAAAALPAALQSKNVCPCPVTGWKPVSCSIWQPVRQHPLPPVQQMPLQVGPLVHAHAPPAHACPVGHLLPHPPQLAASVCVSTQAPRQTVFPAGQTHCPPLQTWAPLQALPQVPQFAVSVWRLVQELPHRFGVVVVLVQSKQALFWQIAVLPHVFPQAPQFSLSALVSRHCGFAVAPQSLKPVQTQLPVEQVPTPQSWPQAPQLRRSFWESTHCGLVIPAGSQFKKPPQSQVPAPQVPTPQSWLQAPQFLALVWRSTQALPHSVVPWGQTQAPAVQEAPVGQTWPQEPQAMGSLWKSLHVPRQSCCPAGHDFLPAQPLPATRAAEVERRRNQRSVRMVAMFASRLAAVTLALAALASERNGRRCGARRGAGRARSRGRDAPHERAP
jgi:hypothetical protein